jgi:hypothetical protein
MSDQAVLSGRHFLSLFFRRFVIISKYYFGFFCLVFIQCQGPNFSIVVFTLSSTVRLTTALRVMLITAASMHRSVKN